MYSVSRMTEGAWIESFCEWSMWPLCSSTRATPLKIITTARLSVHTLMGSKEVFRTKTLPFISADITRARKRVSKYVRTQGIQSRAGAADRSRIELPALLPALPRFLQGCPSYRQDRHGFSAGPG